MDEKSKRLRFEQLIDSIDSDEDPLEVEIPEEKAERERLEKIHMQKVREEEQQLRKEREEKEKKEAEERKNRALVLVKTNSGTVERKCNVHSHPAICRYYKCNIDEVTVQKEEEEANLNDTNIWDNWEDSEYKNLFL